ncbi:MAG: EFR1 family ferrodoxin, partial [Elusimicrobiota bacterium]
NTLLMAKKVAQTFTSRGVNVKLLMLEKSDPKSVNLDNMLGLAFPVAGFSTYPFVWDFIEALPETKTGTKVFMLDTLGGASGGIVGPLRQILRKKGYDTVGVTEIIMPPNIWIVYPERWSKYLVLRGERQAQKFVENILAGNASWHRVPVLSDIVYHFSRWVTSLWRWDVNQKWFPFRTNKKKCNKCNRCIKICPRENIYSAADGYPSHLDKCEYCMRCASFCPKDAIICGWAGKKRYHAAGVEYTEFE